MLSLAFAFAFGGAPTPRDPWFGRDKALHFMASALIQGTAYTAFHQLARYGVAIQRASLVTAGVGIGKELYDWKHPDRHDASWRDLAWDAIGGGTASVIVHQGAR